MELAQARSECSEAEPSEIGKWFLAARPRTLPLAVAPVLVGTAVAHAEGGARPLPALAAFAGAICLQIGANFANDASDAARGADTEARTGPPRAVQQGWLSPAAVWTGAAVAFAAATAVGLFLVSLGGWPIAALGVLSMLAAVAYTGGPWPLGYHGLGEVTVFLFFGLGAVCGTAFVQTGAVSAASLAASVPVGALAAAVLLVNNVRDAETDRDAGKRTVAVRFGTATAERAYHGLVVGSLAVPALWAAVGGSPALLLACLSAPLAFRVTRSLHTRRGAALNETLADTARLAVVFAFLFALGIALS